MFNQPTAGGGFLKPAEMNGHLVLFIVVHEIGKRYDQLRNEEIDQAVVDVVDLEGDNELRERVNVTHKGIVSRLAPGATFVLGRIGQVATKSGFQAWALLPFNEGVDDAKAEAWVNAHKPTFTQAAPASVQAAPAPSPAATPAPAVQPPVNTTTGEIAGGVDLSDPAVQALLAQVQASGQTAPAAAPQASSNPPF
jgi:hypothetical protein